MISDNEIADKLDLKIGKMFNHCQELQRSPSQYIFFKENATANAYWVILIFFAEETYLDEALRDGTCYQIHEYFLHNLYSHEEFREINFNLDFDFGTTPNSKEDLEELFSKFTHKLIMSLDVQSNEDVCRFCNHDFGKHQLRGEIDEELGYPIRGWMICPEDSCKCFRTWSHQTES